MKRMISCLLTAIIIVLCMAPPLSALAEKSFSDGFGSYLGIVKSISVADAEKRFLTSSLSFCNEDLMFVIVVDSYDRSITQIFFIGKSDNSDAELNFIIDNSNAYILTLARADSEYAYHTIYKDEANLIHSLAAASNVSIIYKTGESVNEYMLSESELNDAKPLFQYLDEYDFVSAVNMSYIDTCKANSLLYPIKVSEAKAMVLPRAFTDGKVTISAEDIVNQLKSRSVVSKEGSLLRTEMLQSQVNTRYVYYLLTVEKRTYFVVVDIDTRFIVAALLDTTMNDPYDLLQINSMLASALYLQDDKGSVLLNDIGMSNLEIGTCLREFYQAWKR